MKTARFAKDVKRSLGERHYGAFLKEVPLPSGELKLAEIQAKFEDGVLFISIPKIAPTPPVVEDDDITTIDIN